MTSNRISVMAALEAAARAMDDWARSYAPECCDSAGIDETRGRIINGGGTLAYAARVSRQVRNALDVLAADSPDETTGSLYSVYTEDLREMKPGDPWPTSTDNWTIVRSAVEPS